MMKPEYSEALAERAACAQMCDLARDEAETISASNALEKLAKSIRDRNTTARVRPETAAVAPVALTTTRCEFRLISGSSPDADRCLGLAAMSSVPIVGEIVSLSGNPYVVHERGWATELSQKRNEPLTNKVYCYLRVTKLFGF